MLLDRLAARRYFRPVFRALPSSTDAKLQAGAEALAEVFRQPDTRYNAERRIEKQAGLPIGTVTIHCPQRKTARKIANVLLTRRSRDGEDEICKLKDIGSLDRLIFGEHEKAVKAVEQMYGSMWRLMVYVAPEYQAKHEEISNIAGQVIFETIDFHRHFADTAITWKNDPTLERELAEKSAPMRGLQSYDDSELSPLGELIGQLSDELLESGRLTNIPSEFLGAAEELPADVRERIEAALLQVLSPESTPTSAEHTRTAPTGRTDQMVSVFRTYVKKPRRQDVEDFKRRYSGPLDSLTHHDFDLIVSQLRTAISETQEIDRTPSTVHSGFKLKTLFEVLDELLEKRGVSAPSRPDNKLFEDQS